MTEVIKPAKGKDAVAHAASRLGAALVPLGRAIAASAQSAARSSGVTDLGKPVPAEVRIGQVLAAFSLMFVVPVGMAFVAAIHQVAVDVFDGLGILETAGIAVVLLFVGLGLFLCMVWLCFKWVSSQGFGLFSFGKTRSATK